MTTFRATPKLSTRRLRRNWFSGFGWLWSADRLHRRGLSRLLNLWFSGFGWLWSADRLHRRGLSRLLNLWWHRCLPCGPTVGCRTKHPAISNNLPKLENLNSAFKTVKCHFSFLLLDFGDQHHLSIRIAKVSAGPSDLLPLVFRSPCDQKLLCINCRLRKQCPAAGIPFSPFETN